MHILHKVIGSPQIRLESHDRTAASLSVSPLPTGYGITIGNALRRVLLSSLPGTAITALRIDGATHEYATIKGVKESVFDITLNLRELDLKKHTAGVEVVEILLKKSGVITAADMKVSSDIEILNPTQIIATCDGANAKQKMYVRVEKGVGYQLVSNKDNAANPEPEFILIDANFSPIVHVRYSVEPARVGANTDLDELKMDVKTNGAISAQEAIKFAAHLMEQYFNLFNIEDAYSDEEFVTSFEQMKRQRESEQLAAAKASETSFTPIDILGLSQRTLNALVNGGITSVEQLLQTPMSQLVQLRGFGQKARTELEQILQERGYSMPGITNETV